MSLLLPSIVFADLISDCQNARSFATSLNYPGDTSLSQTNCCGSPIIQCIPNTSVTAILMSNMNLNPTSTPNWIKIRLLTALTKLELSNNKIPGTLVDNNIPNIPMGTITHLNISHNLFTGQLPPITSQIISYDCSYNAFTNPPMTHDPLNAIIIKFNNNLVSPPDPNFSFALSATSLIHLDISTNQFTKLPNLPNLPNLQYLNAADNNLDGIVPRIPNAMLTLDLSYNQFRSMDVSDAQGRDLKYLNLSHNQITSDITGLYGFTALSHVDLSYNGFTGNVPIVLQIASTLLIKSNRFNSLQFSNTATIQSLDISENSITTLGVGSVTNCDLSNNPISTITSTTTVSHCKPCTTNTITITVAYYTWNSIILVGTNLNNNYITFDTLKCPNGHYLEFSKDGTEFYPVQSGMYDKLVFVPLPGDFNPKNNRIRIKGGLSVTIINPFLSYAMTADTDGFKLPVEIQNAMSNTDSWEFVPSFSIASLFHFDENLSKNAKIDIIKTNKYFNTNIYYVLQIKGVKIPGFIRINYFQFPILKLNELTRSISNTLLQIKLSDLIYMVPLESEDLVGNTAQTPGLDPMLVPYLGSVNAYAIIGGNSIYEIKGEFDGGIIEIGTFNGALSINEKSLNYTIVTKQDRPWVNLTNLEIEVNIKIKSLLKSSVHVKYTCEVGLFLNTFNYNENGIYDICAICPIGAQCYVNGDSAVALANYYKINMGGVLEFVQCMPIEACNGNNECHLGYSGTNCGSCDLRYYRNGVECLACPVGFGVKEMVGIAMGALIVMGLLLYLKVKFGSYLVVFGILFQYFQILYIYKSLILNWSDDVLSFFTILSVFSFNLELARPECSVPGVTYFTKAKAFMVVPPVFFGVLLLVAIMLTLKTMKPTFEILKKHCQTSLAIYHMFIQVVYVSLCTWILGFFSCKRFGTSLVMVKYPSESCMSEVYKAQMPNFVLGILVYVIGVPLYFSTLFYWKNQNKNMRLKGFSTGWLYSKTSDFKDNGQYIMAVHLSLKCCIVACQAFLNDVTILQAIIVMLLIFTYLGFLIHTKPYKKNEHTIIDIFCQVCSIITLSCGILFYVLQFGSSTTSTSTTQSYADPLTFVVIASTILLSIVVLIQMRKDFKNGKTKTTLEGMKPSKVMKSDENIKSNAVNVVKSSGDDIDIKQEPQPVVIRKPTTGRSRGVASMAEQQKRSSSMVTNGTEVPPVFQDDFVKSSARLKD